MGTDKANLLVDGETMSQRILRQLRQRCEIVTILGREPIEGCAFLEDLELHAGPLAALSRFTPQAKTVFIVSCDLPRFDGAVVSYFASIIDGKDAVIPSVDGRLQPLCALYSAAAVSRIEAIYASGVRRLQAWTEQLSVIVVSPEELLANKVDHYTANGANSPQELATLLNLN